MCYLPSRQNEQLKHQSDVWNLFNVNIEGPERRQWSRSSVFIVNFEQISDIDLVFPLLTLNK